LPASRSLSDLDVLSHRLTTARRRRDRESVERLGLGAMQEVEHQKQALQTTLGAVAE